MYAHELLIQEQFELCYVRYEEAFTNRARGRMKIAIWVISFFLPHGPHYTYNIGCIHTADGNVYTYHLGIFWVFNLNENKVVYVL